jgi:hypothetical protein
VPADALREQPFAAALAPAGETGTAAFGPHPGTEAVLTFARSLGWLVGAFHKTESFDRSESGYSRSKASIVNDTEREQ